MSNKYVLMILSFFSLVLLSTAQNHNITGTTIVCNSYYIEGTDLELNFTLDAISNDAEFLDYVEISFPSGIIPNSCTSIGTVVANSISGQIVSWGIDNQSGWGPISTGDEYSFTVNVTVIGGLSGDQISNYYIAGDTYGDEPHTINSSFSIYELPACLPPTEISIINIAGTSAELIWTEEATTTSWDIEWGVEDFVRSGIPTENDLTIEFFSFSSLTPGETYDVYLRSDCGSNNLDTSSWQLISFTTALPGDNCMEPISINLPSDFTDNIYQDLLQTTTNRGNYNDTSCLDNYDGGEDIFYELQLGTDMEISIELDPKTTAWTGISLNSGCPSSSNCIATNSNTNASVYGIYNVFLSAGTYFIMVDIWPSPNSISEFDLTIMQNTCPEPTAISIVDFGSDFVELYWAMGSANNWDIELGAQGFSPTGIPTYDNITNNLFLIDGLVSETSYEFYVRADCGIDTSNWVGPYVITTTAICPMPSDLNAINITDSSVDLIWNGYSADNWDIMLGVAGFDTSSSSITVNDFSTNMLGIDTLEVNTSYEFYVRADCGSDNIDTSNWVGPFTFTSLCVTELPDYLEVFNTIIPDCWTVASGGDLASGPSSFGNSEWNSGNFPFGDEDVKINLWTNSYNEWLISPEIDLSGGIWSLFVDVAVTDWNNSSPDLMGSDDEVHILITEDNWTTFTSLISWTSTDSLSNMPSEFEINLSTYNGPIKIAIWASDGLVDDFEDYDFHIDNFNIKSASPCPSPTNLVVSNTSSTGTVLSWISGGASNYNLVYGFSGFDLASSTAIALSDTFYTVVGLLPNMAYQFYVQDSCGEGYSSQWIGPFEFTTNCEVLSDFPYIQEFEGTFLPDCWSNSLPDASGVNDIIQSSIENHTLLGTYSAQFSSINIAEDYNQFLISPTFNIDAENTEFSFWYMMSENDTDTLSLGIVSSTDTIWYGVNYASEWNRISIDLASYIGEDISFVFHYYGDNAQYVYLDDFVIEGPTLTNNYAEDYSIKIYPNPNNGYFNISINLELHSDIKVQLFDINGKLVLSKLMSKTEFCIDAQSINSGIYSLILSNKDTLWRKKLIIIQ